MAKGKRRFYAVRRGYQPGIYKSWEECSVQVLGFPSADHKSFSTESEARAYLHASDVTALHTSEHGISLQDNDVCTEVSQVLQVVDSSQQRSPLEDPTCQPAKKRAVGLYNHQPVGGSDGMLKESPAGTESTDTRLETLNNVDVVSNSASPNFQSNNLVESSQNLEQRLGGEDGDAVRSNLASGTADAGVAGPSVLINAAALQRRAKTISEEPVYVLEFDGASKGNPGPAGAGAVLRKPDGTIEEELVEYVGPKATNNAAEYRGLIIGLEAARARGIRRLHVKGDSKLVVCQMLGRWKVQNVDMIALHKEAKSVAASFEEFKIEHMLREFNSTADKLANIAVLRAPNGRPDLLPAGTEGQVEPGGDDPAGGLAFVDSLQTSYASQFNASTTDPTRPAIKSCEV
ncbi:hypothetical protein KFL_000530290 [Klebsormidium nitens]|uniref:ribonuclease H n=1 Tax=Klebsormidium nitens TaxID=105231 RepID=A0A1Y1HRH7_KLENI|nr:hypothetical protein KFL_000530290 [Klebsormidium nitens]|eukprot:GAQ80402.1 hypothetical protein KFL_000530290 [Klebsormidium nitens]